MRRFLIFFEIMFPCVLAQAADSILILEAFNLPFTRIIELLGPIRENGFSHILVSPPQLSLRRPEWWARYQPVDYRVIDGPLGSESELKILVEKAHTLNLRILVDAVLNHMASTADYPTLAFPEFGPTDFHFSAMRPCIVDWSNRFEVTHHWFCGGRRMGSLGSKLPDLDTESNHVREVHRKFLQHLIDVGVDGFRFDAAKHIELSYFERILPLLVSEAPLFYFGEIVGTSVAEYQEYWGLMIVTDFSLLGSLIRQFGTFGDLRTLPYLEVPTQNLPQSVSVAFVANHDTALHKEFFNFSRPVDEQLANAFLLSWDYDHVSVYLDDWSQPMIQAGLGFRKKMLGVPIRFSDPWDFCYTCNRPDLLFLIRRGEGFQQGLVILNKSDSWFSTEELYAPHLSPGCYREMRYLFSMRVEKVSQGKHRVTDWGGLGNSQMRIGPNTALFFYRITC